MSWLPYVLLVGIPLAWHVALAALAYYDAGNHGMDPVFWGTVSLLVPFFGFVAYLFERDERVEDPDDQFVEKHYFEVHESRADDVEFDWSGDGDRDDASDGSNS